MTFDKKTQPRRLPFDRGTAAVKPYGAISSIPFGLHTEYQDDTIAVPDGAPSKPQDVDGLDLEWTEPTTGVFQATEPNSGKIRIIDEVRGIDSWYLADGVTPTDPPGTPVSAPGAPSKIEKRFAYSLKIHNYWPPTSLGAGDGSDPPPGVPYTDLFPPVMGNPSGLGKRKYGGLAVSLAILSGLELANPDHPGLRAKADDATIKIDGEGFLYAADALGSLKAGPGINLDPPTPTATPTGSVTSGAGLGIGAYQYWHTDITPAGESRLSPVLSLTTTTGNQQTSITIPAVSDAGIFSIVTSRKLYRSKVGASVARFLQNVSGRGATTITDSTPDSGLGARFAGGSETVSVDLAEGPHDGWAYGVHTTYTGHTDPMSGLLETDGEDAKGMSWNLAHFGGLLRNTGLSKSGGDDHNGANVNLAHVGGVNQSGMVEDAGDDINGLQVCIAGSAAPTLKRDPNTGCLQVVGLTSSPPSTPPNGTGGNGGPGGGGTPPGTTPPGGGGGPNPTGSPPTGGTPGDYGHDCLGNAGAPYAGFGPWFDYTGTCTPTTGSTFNGTAGATMKGKGCSEYIIQFHVGPPPGEPLDITGHAVSRFVMFHVSGLFQNTNPAQAWRWYAGADSDSGHLGGTAIHGLCWFAGSHVVGNGADRWQFTTGGSQEELTLGAPAGPDAWIALWYDCNGSGWAAIGSSPGSLVRSHNPVWSIDPGFFDTGDLLRIGFQQGGVLDSSVLGVYAEIDSIYIFDALPPSIHMVENVTGTVLNAPTVPFVPPSCIPSAYQTTWQQGWMAYVNGTGGLGGFTDCPWNADPNTNYCLWWEAGYTDAWNAYNATPSTLRTSPPGSDQLCGGTGPAPVPESVP